MRMCNFVAVVLLPCDSYESHQLFECSLLMTEEYHSQNGNVDQYVTLQQFKGCDMTQLLLSEDGIMTNVELSDYYMLLAASHNGL